VVVGPHDPYAEPDPVDDKFEPKWTIIVIGIITGWLGLLRHAGSIAWAVEAASRSATVNLRHYPLPPNLGIGPALLLHFEPPPRRPASY